MTVLDYVLMAITVVAILFGMMSAGIQFFTTAQKQRKSDKDFVYLVLVGGIVLSGIFSLVFYAAWPAFVLPLIGIYWGIQGCQPAQHEPVGYHKTHLFYCIMCVLYFVIWVFWLKYN